MKVAVIGAGYWGAKHVKEYLAMGCEVTVVDTDPERRKYCMRMGARTASLAQAMSDQAVRHVSVCAPNRRHFELASRAAGEGKHLLVEKPLCPTSGQARSLHRLALRKGTKLLCGHIYRFNNAVERAGRLILSGRLGDVLQVKCSWHQNLDFVRDRNILLDIGLHPVDIVHYWFGGAPRRAECVPRAFTAGYAQSAFLDYSIRAGGRRTDVAVDLNWISPLRRRDVVVLGTRRALSLAAADQILTVYDGAGRASGVRLKKNNALRDQLKYFVRRDARAIEGGTKANGRVSAEILKILELVDGDRLARCHA